MLKHLLLLSALLVPASAEPSRSAIQPTHPLSPLTKEELTSAVEILKASGKADGSTKFSILALKEPPKDAVIHFQPGDKVTRQAFAVLYDRSRKMASEAVVD